MPKMTAYVWCSCGGFHCRDNPDGMGHKLQTTQTAARHRNTDEQLCANCGTVAAQQLTDHWLASPQANAEDFGTGPNSSGDLSGDEVLGDVAPGSLPIGGEAAHHGGTSPPRFYPELDKLFERWEPGSQELNDVDFSSNSDKENFQWQTQEVDDPPDEADAQDVNDLFASAGVHFDYSDTQEDVNIHSTPPPCIQDHPAVRNAYIQAYVLAAFSNTMHAAVYHNLEGKEHLLHMTQAANSDIEYPGLNNFTRTLPTLLKCLSLNCIIHLSSLSLNHPTVT
ncbi:hypothetical protein PAXRUDRAFT_777604 [Paxillus rubicundulus Ve08.2h10]|uniref:Uncharacterized protein n=1 Tax=Paxillus rubicundulus Ve08.2h10 TaxID=930991 RepID=A0A0D0DYY3_9AGAM|nr:hypothetical protein PAXRUDRAFT_777604 [Paxillus rubicundulus Ve08.2h10]